MNQHLIDHIDNKITNAANFVCKFMPVGIDTDQAYEAMLECSAHTDIMRKAFQAAVKFLPPTPNTKRFNLSLPDGRIASITARFAPTPKWPAFLIPGDSLVVNSVSPFAALLEVPVRVATEWEQLGLVWRELCKPQLGLDNQQLAYLLPWIRECLADFDTFHISELTKTERGKIEREIATVMNDANIRFFPRMSAELNAIARSGRVLFSQFRMIEAAYTNEALPQACIAVERTPSLIPAWVKEHLTEMREEWESDINIRAIQKIDAERKKLLKEEADRHDRMVRRGTRI